MLLEKIKAATLAARKARQPQAGVLLTLQGAIDTRSKTLDPVRPLSDEEIVAEVRKLLKGLNETEGYLPAGPSAKRDQIELEKATLEPFLPKQMSDAELKAFAEARVAAGDNMGQIMAALKQAHPGEYDGKTASAIVKAALA
ncbi:GatB/YqeY domain-containing protein [Martelella sp. HB161492]|uniref:GatB/YqeY domain-containing protein n=1 Tax=Martelella sp. HB161492 TaxID=2720726 RepID=UPI00159053B7|nr:GatB/YqeY domain-containing protein [Martelella sp. HB161492]